MRRLLLLPATLLLSGASALSAQGDEITAEIGTFQFKPNAITVKAGDRVTWINRDAIEHSVTAEPAANGTPLFDTGLFRKGESRSLTFDSPGEYRFRCKRHKSMTGVVTVN